MNLNLDHNRINFNTKVRQLIECWGIHFIQVANWVNFNFLFFSAVGVCVFPDVHSKDKSHVPFSPDNVNHKIVHEYQEVSSPVISMLPASFEENKIVSKEQSTKEEEADVMGEIMENTLSTR